MIKRIRLLFAIGRGCTSLGKYIVDNSYIKRFGLAYKLYGLDKTNDKAFQRFVVLHAHECVPETMVKDNLSERWVLYCISWFS
ncbi:MAG: murein L,D-transpeptidase catalytic domain-containing protein [Chitinophagaceae bacterium]